MLDQIHDSHYYCRESRISKHSPASNAPSKAIVAAQKELQKIKSSLPDVSVQEMWLYFPLCYVV